MGKKSSFKPSKYRSKHSREDSSHESSRSLDNNEESSSSSYNTYDKTDNQESKNSTYSHVSSSNSETELSSSYISESIITTKGGVKKKQYRMDSKKINELLDELCDKHYTKLNKLSGDLKIKFMQLRKIIDMLKNTEAYDILLSRINKKFENVDRVEVGTIGSYCVGCKYNNKSCSPTCSGSIQHDQEESPCQHMVIMTELDGNKYSFNILKGSEQDYQGDSAILYLPHSQEEFRGFTVKEKKILKHYGVYNIEFRGYDEDGNTTFNTKDNVHIDDCPTRKHHRSKEKKSGDDYMWVVMLVIVFIVFLIIGGFLLYGYWSNKFNWA